MVYVPREIIATRVLFVYSYSSDNRHWVPLVTGTRVAVQKRARFVFIALNKASTQGL